MKIIIAKDYEDMSRKAANIIAAQVVLKEDSVLGLATGSTVLGLYKQLIEKFKNGDVDFSKVSTVNLDEYVGLAGNHPQSYRYYMEQNLFNHVNIRKEAANLPSGTAGDIASECANYESLIHSLGGIDLQLLGLGNNGHIGFNEPDSIFEKYTHRVELTEDTIQANSRFFGDGEAVPESAVTMGIKTIMQAKSILLCVNGMQKAGILNQALNGAVTPSVPASILQMHRDVTVVADKEAAQQLNL